MSNEKGSFQNIFLFSQVWPRVLSKTNITKYKELAAIVGVTPGRVTSRAKEENFPVDWAYWVAKKYNLNIDWLLTGEGGAEKGDIKEEDKILQEIISWVKENSKKNESFKFWFLFELEQKFPDFKEWRRGKEQTTGKDILDLFNPISQNDSK